MPYYKPSISAEKGSARDCGRWGGERAVKGRGSGCRERVAGGLESVVGGKRKHYYGRLPRDPVRCRWLDVAQQLPKGSRREGDT